MINLKRHNFGDFVAMCFVHMSPARDFWSQVTGSRDRAGFMQGKRLDTLTFPSEERLG